MRKQCFINTHTQKNQLWKCTILAAPKNRSKAFTQWEQNQHHHHKSLPMHWMLITTPVGGTGAQFWLHEHPSIFQIFLFPEKDDSIVNQRLRRHLWGKTGIWQYTTSNMKCCYFCGKRTFLKEGSLENKASILIFFWIIKQYSTLFAPVPL